MNEGYNGELLEVCDLLDILDVFGEDGLRSYLAGVLEGEEDAKRMWVEPTSRGLGVGRRLLESL